MTIQKLSTEKYIYICTTVKANQLVPNYYLNLNDK